MKVADLKNELKLRNLATTGKRDELLKRLQNAIAQGVEREDDIDEDAILAGDDEGDDDGLTPMEEEAVLAPKATPARASRRSVAATSTPATPARGTPARRPALKRTAAANLVVPEVEEPTPKAATPVKTPAKEPAVGTPPAKVAKIETPKPAVDSEANKENGEPEKTAAEKRAERFGIVSDDTAKSKRADRFGIVSDDLAKKKREERFGAIEKKESKALKKAKMTNEPVDVEKIKARAERFGTTTSSALDAEKKKSRLDRFGTASNGTGKDVTSDEAKAARAEKFASEPAAPVISASGKTLITFGSEDADKLKRQARFAEAK